MKRFRDQEEAPDVEERGLSRAEAAAVCGLNASYLANAAVFGLGPPFRKLKPGKRGRVIYIRSELLEWLRNLPQHGSQQHATAPPPQEPQSGRAERRRRRA